MKHFYNLYVKAGKGAEPKVWSADSIARADVTCVRHGMSIEGGFVSISAFLSLLRGFWRTAIILFISSKVISAASKTAAMVLQENGVLVAGMMAFIFFVFASCTHALIEAEVIRKNGKWLGTVCAEGQDDAVRIFFTSISGQTGQR